MKCTGIEQAVKPLMISLLLLAGSVATGVQAMTQDEMEKMLTARVELIESRQGYIVFEYEKVKMALVSDVEHDRMRIVSPVAVYSEITLEQVNAVMEANYHRALDARYASSDDILYALFIHPLSPLTEAQLLSALQQVATLALTFGSSYSSGQLSYGGN